MYVCTSLTVDDQVLSASLSRSRSAHPSFSLNAKGSSESEMLKAALSEREQNRAHANVLKIPDPGNQLPLVWRGRCRKDAIKLNKVRVACFFQLQSINVVTVLLVAKQSAATPISSLKYTLIAHETFGQHSRQEDECDQIVQEPGGATSKEGSPALSQCQVCTNVCS